MRKGAKMNYTKNNDPNYYEKHQGSSNCGSFAFQIEEWYSPDEGFDVEEWIDCGYNGGWDDYELADSFVEQLIPVILDDFDNVRFIFSKAELESNEELIAFRTWVEEGNWDFHFKVLRDGLWQEKCGSDPVRFCSEDDWHNGIMDYNSYTVYFARKLAS